VRGRAGRGRRGPGLLGTMARTAVVAGTAQSVAGRVAMNQQASVQGRPAAAAPAGPAGVDRLHTELTKLGQLRQSGLLTDEEFAAQKARLLATP
jgi:Short C-terminal domain